MEYIGNIRGLPPSEQLLRPELAAVRIVELPHKPDSMSMVNAALRYKYEATKRAYRAANQQDRISIVNAANIWPTVLSVWHGLEETMNIIERIANGKYKGEDNRKERTHHLGDAWGRIPGEFQNVARKAVDALLTMRPFPVHPMLIGVHNLDTYLHECGDNQSMSGWRYFVRDSNGRDMPEHAKFMHIRVLLEAWNALTSALRVVSGGNGGHGSSAGALFRDVEDLFQHIPMPPPESGDWGHEMINAITDSGSVLQMVLRHMAREKVAEHPHNVRYLNRMADAMPGYEGRSAEGLRSYKEDWSLLCDAARKAAIRWNGSGWDVNWKRLRCHHHMLVDGYCSDCDWQTED